MKTPEKVTIVHMAPVRTFATKDIMGTVRIYRQHDGDEAVLLVTINYDHRHIDNSGQRALGNLIMAQFGGGAWVADERVMEGGK